MGNEEELDDDAWDSEKDGLPEEPESKRMTVRAPSLGVSPSQPPTVRPNTSQIAADDSTPPDEAAPKG